MVFTYAWQRAPFQTSICRMCWPIGEQSCATSRSATKEISPDFPIFRTPANQSWILSYNWCHNYNQWATRFNETHKDCTAAPQTHTSSTNTTTWREAMLATVSVTGPEEAVAARLGRPASLNSSCKLVRLKWPWADPDDLCGHQSVRYNLNH